MPKQQKQPKDREIERFLAKADPVLGQMIAAVVAKAGIQRPQRDYDSSFHALARSIISQQLSTKAAATIHGRFMDLAGKPLTPKRVSALTIDQLRSIGLSLPKARYMHNLAAWFTEHGAKADDPSLSDEELIKLLTSIKGIGVWTVQMFLMFHLRRPDVLPVGDLGIQKGFQTLYSLKKKPAPTFMTRKAKAWQPHRSTACLYLWKMLDVGN